MKTRQPPEIDGSGSVPINPERLAAVDRAREQWVKRLIDLSRRNRLLYFRDLKTGTIDLSPFASSLLPPLFLSQAVRISDLLEEDEQKTAIARLFEIRRKARENLEEKGLDTMYLGLGIATWNLADGGRPPAAPVFLLPITIDIRGRDGRTSTIRRVGDIEINPVLVHALSVDHGVPVPGDEIVEALDRDGGDPEADLQSALSKITQHAKDVPGFTVQGRVVLGNFSFQKMAMVRDLEEYRLEIAAHDLIAGLAGDAEARNSIAESRHCPDPRTLDQAPVRNEQLILDADSSQQTAIAAVLKAQDGVVQGPPGTGKSQTIANLIAALAGEGKRILFVAEKRAALEVVSRRLTACGLGHLYLDLHGADIRRRDVAKRLSECLATVKDSTPVSTEEMDERLEDRRKRLNEHVSRMHAPRQPSGMSAYQLQGELLRLPSAAQVTVRWQGKALDKIMPEVAQKIGDLLQEAGATPGLFLRDDRSPWAGARVEDERQLREALDLTSRLASASWPAFVHAISAAAAEAGLTNPKTLSEATELLTLIRGAASLLEEYGSAIFSLDLAELTRLLAPLSRGMLPAAWAWCSSPRFRSALRAVRSVRKGPGGSWASHFRAARQAQDVLRQWRKRSGENAVPCRLKSLPDAAQADSLFRADLVLLKGILNGADLADMDLERLGSLISALCDDRDSPYLLPNLHRIERDLESLGAATLVAVLRKLKPVPLLWRDCLYFAWLSSCLESTRASDPLLASFNGRLHDQYVEEFQRLDQDRLDAATLRIRRMHAERAVAAMNEHHDQEALVRREARKTSRHLPIRHLLAEAPDVVLSLCPCWMASPLSVSHLLDGKRKYFDVVLFDEASQVPPEDAIPSILRGSRAVVAGDRNQLPPTTFFETDVDEEAEQEVTAPTVGFESVLDIMSAFLEPWNLDWHYRSRDERLIAFSNRWIYGDRLITFPSTGGEEVISHVTVPPELGPSQESESSSSEVRRVVDLVLQHAAERPEESLGVIAMGLKHALRTEREVWRARQDHPELEEFFDETREERFFVKNLERVQGDERDAIILTVGYGKDPSGRLLNRFGPLNFDGGERRLNVAVTRARERLTVVSSFQHSDMDPSRFGAKGVALLKDYLEYADSGGHALRTSGASGIALNAFEADVFDTLTARGMKLIPQWGVSRYRIDMVAQDPQEPGRLVLAIECDGASYHSAYTARDRDRLRQQQLEALGWRFHRIWSADWFLRKDDEVRRALDAYELAVRREAGRSPLRGARQKVDRLVSVARIDTPPVRGAPSSAGSAEHTNRGDRPRIIQRNSITDYRQGELVALLRWILSDGRVLTDEEITVEMMSELGFRRRGARIDAAIRSAIAVAKNSGR